MIESVKHAIKIRKLQRRLRDVDDKFFDSKNALIAAKKRDDIAALEVDARMDHDEIDEEIRVRTTRRLGEVCTRLFLPMPPMDDQEFWTQNPTFGRYHLTEAGVMKIRTMIRQERKDRIDWLTPLVATSTGIVGALTGLAAILVG